MIDLKAIAEQLTQTYPVKRKTETEHIINSGLSMIIITTANILESEAKVESTIVEFIDKSISPTSIRRGAIYDMLKEKYFKSEMVIH